MRPRSETFFVFLDRPFEDIYFPKQSAKEVRPVRRVVIYERNNLAREPYFFELNADKPTLSQLTVTFRDPDDRELIRDAPATMFGDANSFAKPSVLVPAPIMHARRQFGPMLIDPQRSAIRSTGVKNALVAVEFIYTD